MTGRTNSAPGRDASPQRQADVGAEPAAGDQDESLHIFGVLVDKLHGDTTAEEWPTMVARVIPSPSRMSRTGTDMAPQRVVTARFRRVAVPQEVRSHHPVLP